ncbi:MAG TPA: hypothetical protein VNN08_14800, partial [Thermoanaerobaculia bacterium]|nr:hypothetical protein [Thermoanaerobaculia bacterium]
TKMSNRGMKRLFFKAGLLLFLNLLGIVEFSEKRLEALVPRGPEPASDDEPQPLAPPPQTSASGTEQPPTAVYEGSEGPKLRTLKPQPGSASGAGDFVVKGENDSGVIAEELKVQHDDSS